VSLSTAGAWKLFASFAKYYAVPTDMPKPDLFSFYGDVYGPGPMILFRQVEVLSSRAQVIAALQSVLGQPHAISVADVIGALEAKTGLDLTSYAAAWLENSGTPKWPQLNLTYDSAAGTLTVHEVTPLTPHKGCAFHVELDGAAAGQSVTVAVDTFHNAGDQTLTVPAPGFTVTQLVLDPAHECLVFLGTATPREQPVWRNPWVAADQLAR